jgi:hypothetical protein
VNPESPPFKKTPGQSVITLGRAQSFKKTGEVSTADSPAQPVRIKLRRKGKIPKEINGLPVVVVTRATGSKFANPFRIGPGVPDVAASLRLYEQALRNGQLPFTWLEAIRELRGKNLVCYCQPGRPCHADFLLRIANIGDPQNKI